MKSTYIFNRHQVTLAELGKVHLGKLEVGSILKMRVKNVPKYFLISLTNERFFSSNLQKKSIPKGVVSVKMEKYN